MREPQAPAAAVKAPYTASACTLVYTLAFRGLGLIQTGRLCSSYKEPEREIEKRGEKYSSRRRKEAGESKREVVVVGGRMSTS